MVEITKQEFEKFSRYVKSNYGINFKEEKMPLISGRLSSVIESYNLENLSEYLDYVIADKTGEALSLMLDKITTNHTFFMRESQHFKLFKEHNLPMLERKVKDKDLRIWSAACSSGEEPYTLAMIIDEYFGTSKYLWDTKILATDISAKVLDIAREGIYAKEKLATIPQTWKLAYFNKYDNENYIINDKMKKEIIFRRFNLMDKRFPFKKKFHIIFCRNVMIYFDEDTKIELVNKIYDAMEVGGYLFIGHSESLNRDKTKFKYVMPAVYRKE